MDVISVTQEGVYRCLFVESVEPGVLERILRDFESLDALYVRLQSEGLDPLVSEVYVAQENRVNTRMLECFQKHSNPTYY